MACRTVVLAELSQAVLWNRIRCSETDQCIDVQFLRQILHCRNNGRDLLARNLFLSMHMQMVISYVKWAQHQQLSENECCDKIPQRPQNYTTNNIKHSMGNDLEHCFVFGNVQWYLSWRPALTMHIPVIQAFHSEHIQMCTGPHGQWPHSIIHENCNLKELSANEV